MPELRSTSFRCRGHSDLRGTHRKTVEFTKDTHISARATCVLGVAADFDGHALAGFRGPLAITIEAGAHAEVIHAVANPEFRPDESLVIRTSGYGHPDTLAVNADRGAAQLDRGLVAELASAQTPVVVTVEETPAPGRPARGRLTVASLAVPFPAHLTPEIREVVAAADVVIAADRGVGREAVARTRAAVPVCVPAEVDAPARLRAGEWLTYLAAIGDPADEGPLAELGTAATEADSGVRIVPAASLELAARVAGGTPAGTAPYVGLGPSAPDSRSRTQALHATAASGAVLAWRETLPSIEDALADVAAVLGERPVRLAVSLASPQGLILRGTAQDVSRQWTRVGRPPGDLIVVIAADGRRERGDDAAGGQRELATLTARLLETGVPARTIAVALSGLPGRDYRSEYRRVLRLKTGRDAGTDST